MLKKLFALSDQGERELKHGIVATTIGHLCIMAPISLLMLVTMGLLNRLCGETGLTMQPGVIVLMAAVLLLLIFITQWVQYNLTYKVAYEESANRRITLAEKLRRLPLAFFGQRDLSDLTTTMMGDCSKLERIFSNAVPRQKRKAAIMTLTVPLMMGCRNIWIPYMSFAPPVWNRSTWMELRKNWIMW